MSGFFTTEETQSDTLIELKCGRECILKHDSISADCEDIGDGEKDILIVGTCPNDDEMFNLIQTTLSRAGIDLEDDCVYTYSIKCYKDSTPTPNEIEICNFKLQNLIKELKPKIIIPLGEHAIRAVISPVNKRNKAGWGSTLWRGWQIPDRTYNCWICPTYNISEMKHFDGKIKNKAFKAIFKKDIKNALKLLEKDFPLHSNEEKKIKVLTEPNQIKKALKKILRKANTIAFDYETTGLKPDAEGHKIFTCSIATDSESAIAFPMYAEIIPLLKKVIEEPEIKKVCHNAKFEDGWSRVYLGIRIGGEWICTMITAHFLDNRRGCTGLKFQSYVQFGIAEYDEVINPYLKSKGDSNNAFNTINKAPINHLLKYDGMDSMLTFRLAEYQGVL